MPIIETHCHLDYLEKEPLADILQKSKEIGIERIITISVDPENLDKVFALSQAHEEVYFTQGIHPHDAKDAKDDDLKKIIDRSSEPKMVAVGEIGLDYHYNHSPRDIQIKIFEQQLEIAIQTKKPVVIHNRESDDDMMAILKNIGHNLPKAGVVHSFSSSKKLAQVALDQGFYLGFNGMITFKNAQNVRDIVSYAPLERLLIETDSPFLTPTPHRGKENAPFYLPHILEKLAEIKGIPVMEAEQVLYKNSFDLFFS